jgi:hypothetical protein
MAANHTGSRIKALVRNPVRKMKTWSSKKTKPTRGILQQQRERDLDWAAAENSGKDPVGDEPIPRQEIHKDQRAGPGDLGSRFNTRCRDTPSTHPRDQEID